ncbi:MAG TPA: hypothetical protein DCZ59_06585 [Bacteroidetes bacterium]|nr:hypothetical protein [Bacteroidota bacterium]
MRVIIVQTAFLGDVILTLPLCAAVRKKFPHWRIIMVTTPAASDLLRGLSIIDDVIAFDKRNAHKGIRQQHQLAGSLSSGEPTTVLVPHKSLRTALFVRSLRASRVVTYDDAVTRWYASDVVPYPQHLHDAQRHLELLRPLIAQGEDIPPIESLLPISLSDPSSVDLPWDAGSTNPRIVLAPATVWPTKRWPIDRMRRLAGALVHEGMQVCVIGDSSVAGVLADVEGVQDLCGRTTLSEAAAVIATADCVVANDSAPVHLASLQNVGVAAIFGPTVPEFGFGPLGIRTRVVQRADLACRPCSAHGGAKCPLGTHACMTGIDVETLRMTVQSILAHDVNRHAKPSKEIL